jgi:FKBP-type peptidyl-prolyl cis-trans isomerase FkpA
LTLSIAFWMKYFFLLVGVLTLLGCKRIELNLSLTQRADEDETKIREYLAKKGLSLYTRSPAGVFVVVDSAVADQRYIRNGDFVYLRYRGYFPDKEATAFDSNTVDSVATTLRVEMGRSGQVIAGFQEGLRLLRNKEKARFFIPSGQGYGASANGDIPANSILIFDIRVVDVL